LGQTIKAIQAVDDIGFELRESETLGIVGESGSGKSTLSKAILRLINADSGEVEFLGKRIDLLNQRDLRAIRKDIQYIFQDPYSSLNPRLSIGYAIQEPMKIHNIRSTQKERKEFTYELLEKVGLEKSHYNRYPHEFSGGQRQRICIARALAMEPKLIVCDEIVSALDVSVQAQVLNLLVDLRNEFNLSLIFVTHDLSIVRFLCERTLVMRKGKIEEKGWTDELFNDPKSKYTRTLLDSIPGKTAKI
jgi:peptide/nickel transport system ATP-binding protein